MGVLRSSRSGVTKYPCSSIGRTSVSKTENEGSSPYMGAEIKIMEQDNVLNRLVPRLKKIGITIEMVGNYPWIYLEKVNGNRIQREDYFCGNHGFTIAFLPIKPNVKMELTDIKEVFKVIRKYR